LLNPFCPPRAPGGGRRHAGRAKPISVCVISAAAKSAWCSPLSGASSTTSSPTMRRRAATSRIMRITSYHSSPPGTGVPVAGMDDGSSPSTSKVT
jgi:hypothetical protein